MGVSFGPDEDVEAWRKLEKPEYAMPAGLDVLTTACRPVLLSVCIAILCSISNDVLGQSIGQDQIRSLSFAG
jgi:hypothetical protein